MLLLALIALLAPGHAAAETAVRVQNPLPVTAADATWGRASAPVTLVHFGDMQCPFCVRAAKTLTALKKKYGPKQLRIVYKHKPLPFHKQARPAAEVAVAVHQLRGNAAFWTFVNATYSNIGDSGAFGSLAEVGLSEATVKRAIARGTAAQKVRDDLALADRVGVRGTPASFINGVFLSGARPIASFSEVIDKQLLAAATLRIEGMAAGAISPELTRRHFKPPAVRQPATARAKRPAADSTTVWKVPVGRSPQLGPSAAPVTLVVFSDFQCPFCARNAPLVATLHKKYGKKLRIVFKHQPLPFHKRAKPAAQLAMHAFATRGAHGFWRAHDKLFDNSRTLEDADLQRIATELGMNPRAAMAAVHGKRYQAQIEADTDLALDVEARGTPTSFINGRRLRGAQPLEGFVELIDEELAHAAKLRGEGVTLFRMYAHIIKNGKTATPERKTIPSATRANPSKGPANAPVTITIFSDFECPFCQRVLPTLQQIEQAFPRRVRFVFRHKPLPFHKNAMIAHQAAAEAFAQGGNAAFWRMHDFLFANRKQLNMAFIVQGAADQGLNAAKVRAAMVDGKHDATIQRDIKISDDAGIRGTPGFVINGVFVSGAQPFSKFKRAIERALRPRRR